MSRFYISVKRLAALNKRLSQLQGKLKFAIRRGNKSIVLNAIFEIEALEGKIEALTAIKVENVQTPQLVVTSPLKAQKTIIQSKLDKYIISHDKQMEFETYLESLQLPELNPIGRFPNPVQVKAANRVRDIFVRDSLYSKFVNDPTNRLLVFAPSILKLHKFQQAAYWLEHEKEDYAIRADIAQEAVTNRYDSYPVTKESSTGKLHISHK